MIRSAGKRRRLAAIGGCGRMAGTFAASRDSIALAIGEGAGLVLWLAGTSSDGLRRRPAAVRLVTRGCVAVHRRGLRDCKIAGAKNARRDGQLESVHWLLPEKIRCVWAPAARLQQLARVLTAFPRTLPFIRLGASHLLERTSEICPPADADVTFFSSSVAQLACSDGARHHQHVHEMPTGAGVARASREKVTEASRPSRISFSLTFEMCAMLWLPLCLV